MFKYLNIIPFYPLMQMLVILMRYGGFPLEKWQLVIIWFFKLVILEPFRIFEAIVMAILPEKKGEMVFIMGYYRSGTTYLQELLAADESRRTMTVFQSVLPEIALCFSWLFVPLLTAFAKVFKAKNEFHNIAYDWNFPGEDDVALNAMMSIQDYNKVYQYPSYYDQFTERYLRFLNHKEKQRWIEKYSYLIKKLHYINGRKTLVLKSPPNMARIPLLKALFPHAKFVFIHRDPYDCILSTGRLWDLNRTFSFERYSNEQAEQLIIRQYIDFWQLFERHASDISYSELEFNELIHDAQKQIRRVCSELKLIYTERTDEYIRIVSSKRKKSKPASRTIPISILKNSKINLIRERLGYTKMVIVPKIIGGN